MVVEASKNPSFLREVLDRTEGKVAERIEHLDLNKMVEQLEAARRRVLTGSGPQDVVVEGHVIEHKQLQPAVTSIDSDTSK